MRRLLLISLLSACGGSVVADPDAGGQASFIASWPTFHGDCNGSWTPTRAINVTGTDVMGFQVDDLHEGDMAAQHRLSLDFEAGATGVALAVSPDGAQHALHLNFDDVNTHYFNHATHQPGEISGTLTVKSFDAAAGSAEVQFQDAVFIGEDSITAGTFRCSLSGTLRVTGFTRLALGQDCHDDYQCGGNYSGRICDWAKFVCAQGCHVDTDCVWGSSSCDTTAHTCH